MEPRSVTRSLVRIPPRPTLLLGAIVSLIVLATLTPGHASPGAPRFGPPQAADLLLNLALFVPLGLALRHAGWPTRRALVSGAALSTLLELAQWLLVPGRNANPWDVLANGAGAWVGASLPPVLLASAPIAVWLASPLLLAPAAPAAAQWWGQWAHHFSGTVPFDGRVEAVRFNGVPAPDRQLSVGATRAMRAGYDRPPVTLEIRITPAPANPGLAHLASIADGQSRAVVALWQRNAALEADWFSRGTALGLRPPAVRLAGLLDPPLDQGVLITAQAGAGQLRVALTGAAVSRTSSLRLGPWQGWRLLWPLRPPSERLALVVSVGWTLLCLGPLLVLLSSGRSRRRHSAA